MPEVNKTSFRNPENGQVESIKSIFNFILTKIHTEADNPV